MKTILVCLGGCVIIGLVVYQAAKYEAHREKDTRTKRYEVEIDNLNYQLNMCKRLYRGI